jgi:hypothetical protein
MIREVGLMLKRVVLRFASEEQRFMDCGSAGRLSWGDGGRRHKAQQFFHRNSLARMHRPVFSIQSVS